MKAHRSIHVVKLGGSLLDLPGLIDRFNAWRRTQEPDAMLLVVGGGRVADAVRSFDKIHGLGESLGHAHAVAAMRFNADMLRRKLDDAQWVHDTPSCEAVWTKGGLALLEPVAWLERDEEEEKKREATGSGVPRRWSFTSDSIAAYLADRLDADRLTLLKSTLPKGDCGVRCAAGLGMVDDDFAEASAGLPHIAMVNLREVSFPSRVLSTD